MVVQRAHALAVLQRPQVNHVVLSTRVHHAARHAHAEEHACDHRSVRVLLPPVHLQRVPRHAIHDEGVVRAARRDEEVSVAVGAQINGGDDALVAGERRRRLHLGGGGGQAVHRHETLSITHTHHTHVVPTTHDGRRVHRHTRHPPRVSHQRIALFPTLVQHTQAVRLARRHDPVA